MARLIVKSPYFKGGGAKPAGGYLRYIATRERVEILPDVFSAPQNYDLDFLTQFAPNGC